MRPPIIVVSGGIATGKTTVAAVLASRGGACVDSNTNNAGAASDPNPISRPTNGDNANGDDDPNASLSLPGSKRQSGVECTGRTKHALS